jgi:hypothetical protein
MESRIESPLNNIMSNTEKKTTLPPDEQCNLFVYGSLTIRDPDSQVELLKTQA